MAEVKTEKTTKVAATKKAAPKKEEKVVKEEVKKVAPAKGKTIKFPKVLQYTATGRKKQSVARVRLIPNGKGQFVINGKNLEEYFGLGTFQLVAKQALTLVNVESKYDVYVNVNGGGLSGQAGAIRHGIARALVKAEENLKPELKKAGFLTRDSRIKERKKYGLKKARKAPQFRKR